MYKIYNICHTTTNNIDKVTTLSNSLEIISLTILFRTSLDLPHLSDYIVTRPMLFLTHICISDRSKRPTFCL